MENKWFFPEYVPVVTDCLRCNFCSERLSAGVNWTVYASHRGQKRCRSCKNEICTRDKLLRSGSLSEKVARGALRCLSSQLRYKAKKQGHQPASYEELKEFISQCIERGCDLCGCAVNIDTNDPRATNRLQIDQRVPRGGYTLDNMVGLCAPCNSQKSNHTLETSLRLTQYLAKQFDIEIVAKKKARGRVVHADFQAKIKEAIATI